MSHQVDIKCTPKQSANENEYLKIVADILKIDQQSIINHRILKESIDARKRDIVINMRIEIITTGNDFAFDKTLFSYKNVKESKPIYIIGAGPSGLFAALRFIELGIKPIIFERGKDVSSRKLDIAKINRENIVDENSNYCFGEGGAGTFSDGKLYTRSKKRGNVTRILEILNNHGADNNILYKAHPHIGTNKLPKVITNIRETILNFGGEIHFNSKLTDIEITKNKISSIEINNSEKILCNKLVLATGHSARDIYELLHTKNILLEEKPFAMGVRVEHPQNIIDKIQYSCEIRDEFLPAASYNLVQQIDNRGVYSFCMCPGGFIVPAATAPNQIVINGMSPSLRNSKFANSGMVVEITKADLTEYAQFGVLAGMKYQENFERLAFVNGGNGLVAPAQRLVDFVKGRISSSLPETSYHLGIISSPLHHWMPENIAARLQKAFKLFNNKMNGYLTNEAVVIGVESRTSSPVRIPRNKDTFEHIAVKGLFPCGEGAGYAGGIVSAAIDGERIAEIIAGE